MQQLKMLVKPLVDSGALAFRAVGATSDEWFHFDVMLGLGQDLLPVVANQTAKISKDSDLKAIGKVPSRYNWRDEVSGFVDWGNHRTSDDEIRAWSRQPDYGICVITREVRGIDVDVDDDPALAHEIESFIVGYLGFALPKRFRANSSRFLLAVRVVTDDPSYSKWVLKLRTTDEEKSGLKDQIEILLGGHQFVAAGTHASGARIEWAGGLPSEIPELTPQEFEMLVDRLQDRFGKQPLKKQGTASVRTKGVTIDIEDPAAEFLKQKGLVLGQERDGKLLVVCPWVGEHTQGKDGDGSTGYFPAGSNGYLGGGFKCLHGHCEDRKTSDFFAAIGYEPPGTNADGMDDVDTAAERNNDQARLIAARREHQRLENLRIGEGAAKVPAVGKMTLEDMLSRFVFLSDGSQVADLLSPGNVYAFADFAATYAASKIQRGEDRKIPVASLWKTDPHRKTAEALTFKAGGPLLLRDPNGRMAVNSWRPIQRESVHDLMAAGVGLFLDHVEFLFPIQADRERFLDWLAHIEQKPGELPHTAWLHVARNFGMGRNWLASVLARVWAGSVAANLDLPGVLKSGFNGRLSRKLLAVVDEIHEGGRDGPWEHAEKLKSIITEETRLINPKYGRQSVEFNSCRFLMFSNHVSAIPLETGDRRIEVVATDAPPRDGDYYEKLYRALDDPGFINAVGVWLAQRDLRRFNPGQHARMSEAKMKVVQASFSPMAERCQSLTRLWPSDLITAPALYSVLQGPSGGDGALTAFHRRTLEQFGVEPLKQLRVSPGASPVRVSVIRNHGRWRQAVVGELRDELAKCPDDFEGAWHWLAGAEADQAQAT